MRGWFSLGCFFLNIAFSQQQQQQQQQPAAASSSSSSQQQPCCPGCNTISLPFNATVIVASGKCADSQVASVQNVTLYTNGTVIARITSNVADWYNDYHGGFGLRESASYALTCFNEPSERGAVATNISIVAQCLTQGGCTVQHRESFKCATVPKCGCVDCHNTSVLRGQSDQDVLAHLVCPKASDEIVVVRMNAIAKQGQIFNLLVQEDPDSDTYFPAVSAVSASCSSISEFPVSGVSAVYVVAQCVTQACDLTWHVSLRCQSSAAATPSCPCPDCDSSLHLNYGQSKLFTKQCAKEVGVTALRFVTPNQGFRISSNVTWLSSPVGAASTCFFSPQSTIWTGQQQLQTKVDCLDARGCDFTYKLSTVCECTCAAECMSPVIVLPRGEKRTWQTPACAAGEVSVVNTLRVSAPDGSFTVTGILASNQSLIQSLSSSGRTTCFDAYLDKPMKASNSSVEVKCLTQQCSLSTNVSLGCQPSAYYIISSLSNPTQCLTLSGTVLMLQRCNSTSQLQRFVFSLSDLTAVGAVGKAFFLGKTAKLRPMTSSQCVSAQGRLLACSGASAKLKTSGQDNSFNLAAPGKAGGCLVPQQSNVMKSTCSNSFAWAIFAALPL